MKYERMKRNNLRCNAVTPTGVDVEKILDRIQYARELADYSANKMKQKFPSFMGKIRRRIFDDNALRALSLAFSTFRRETNRSIKSIDSAISELNKGKLPACVKYLKLAIEAAQKVTRGALSINDPVIDDVTNDLWATTANLVTVYTVLGDVLRKIGSL